MENNERKSNKVIIIVLVVVLLIALGVGGYFGYKYFTNKPDGNQNQANNTNEIDADTKKKVLNIIGLTEDGISERERFNPYSLQLFLASLSDRLASSSDNHDVIINDIDGDSTKRLIYLYALENKMIKSINGSKYDYCYEGSDECQAIITDDYEVIAKKYGITTPAYKLFSKTEQYGNYYLYKDGGTVAPPGTVKDSYEIEKDNNDIIVKYNYSFKLDGEPDKYYGDTEIKATYTFKQDNNEYYLYKVNATTKVNNIASVYNITNAIKYSLPYLDNYGEFNKDYFNDSNFKYEFAVGQAISELENDGIDLNGEDMTWNWRFKYDDFKNFYSKIIGEEFDISKVTIATEDFPYPTIKDNYIYTSFFQGRTGPTQCEFNNVTYDSASNEYVIEYNLNYLEGDNGYTEQTGKCILKYIVENDNKVFKSFFITK